MLPYFFLVFVPTLLEFIINVLQILRHQLLNNSVKLRGELS